MLKRRIRVRSPPNSRWPSALPQTTSPLPPATKSERACPEESGSLYTPLGQLFLGQRIKRVFRIPDFPLKAARNALLLLRGKRNDLRNGLLAPRNDHLFPILHFAEQFREVCLGLVDGIHG